MKALLLSCCLLLCALPVVAQNADTSALQVHLPAATAATLEAQPIANPDPTQYGPRPILLLSGINGVEPVMPMVFTINGQNHLVFVLGSKIKESMDKGGRPIRLGDVLSALGDATQTIAQLKAENANLLKENDRLWKVAMKANPQLPPPTVVVQQPPPQPPAPQQPSRLERYMLFRSLLPQAPQTQNLNVTVSDCTRFPALCVRR